MIILIEDDNLQAKLLSFILHQNNYKIEHFENGKEALNFIRKNNDKIKLLILDCFLSDFQGIEILEIIFKEKLNIDTCMFSANNCESLKEKTKKLGSIDFFVKGKSSEITRLIKFIKNKT